MDPTSDVGIGLHRLMYSVLMSNSYGTRTLHNARIFHVISRLSAKLQELSCGENPLLFLTTPLGSEE